MDRGRSTARCRRRDRCFTKGKKKTKKTAGWASRQALSASHGGAERLNGLGAFKGAPGTWKGQSAQIDTPPSYRRGETRALIFLYQKLYFRGEQPFFGLCDNFTRGCRRRSAVSVLFTAGNYPGVFLPILIAITQKWGFGKKKKKKGKLHKDGGWKSLLMISMGKAMVQIITDYNGV